MVAPAANVPATRPVTEFLTRTRSLGAWLPIGVALVAFVVLFASPAASLVHD